jgi:hypothetical protein
MGLLSGDHGLGHRVAVGWGAASSAIEDIEVSLADFNGILLWPVRETCFPVVGQPWGSEFFFSHGRSVI